MADPTFNAPEPIDLPGLEDYAVIEIPYLNAREKVGAVGKIVKAFREANPDLKMRELEIEVALELLAESLPRMISSMAEVLDEIMVEAVRYKRKPMASKHLDKLPLGMVFRIMGAAIRKQGPAIEAFFDLGASWREAVTGNGTRTSATPRPTPSSSSSEPASVSVR